jgi:hypothetical protein
MATYTHHSELQEITVLSLISTFYKSLHHKSSLARSVFNSRFLVTDINSGDSSGEGSLPCSQEPILCIAYGRMVFYGVTLAQTAICRTAHYWLSTSDYSVYIYPWIKAVSCIRHLRTRHVMVTRDTLNLNKRNVVNGCVILVYTRPLYCGVFHKPFFHSWACDV